MRNISPSGTLALASCSSSQHSGTKEAITLNYVFRFVVTTTLKAANCLSQWQTGRTRCALCSDDGWTMDEELKPIRNQRFSQRSKFAQKLLFAPLRLATSPLNLRGLEARG